MIGNIDIDAASEADDAEAVARLHLLTGNQRAFDPPRDEAGDLDHRQVEAVRRLDTDGLALIVLGSLIEGGVEEPARPVMNPADGAVRGDAVHMDVEDVHEDADPC